MNGKNENTVININIDKLKSIYCPVCKGDVFYQAFKLKKVPGMLSPTSTEKIIALPVFQCFSCLNSFTEIELLNKKDKNEKNRQSGS